MSHFSVLVIGENIEEQLQPYHEYECTGIDDVYVIKVDCTEEVNEWRQDKLYVGTNDKGALDYQYFEGQAKEAFVSFEEITRAEYLQRTGADVEESIYDWFGYEKIGEKYFKKTNPNAKWDWWKIGGRWNGYLKLKKGMFGIRGGNGLMGACYSREGVSQALKGAIDFTPDKQLIQKHERFWEVLVEEQELLPSEKKEDFFTIYEKEYLLEKYQTKENYARRQTEFSTYAVVKDGVWYGKGEMGWFGISSERREESQQWGDSFFDKWIKYLPDDTLLTIVDCHI